MSMRRFWKILLLGAVCAALLTGCFMQEVEELEVSAERVEAASGDEGYSDDSWAIYWYHCGSDLESKYGCASNDIKEMLSVELPENIKIVLQTGGAKEWHNTQVDASKIQRYVYDSNGFYLVDEQPKSNMGASETLADWGLGRLVPVFREEDAGGRERFAGMLDRFRRAGGLSRLLGRWVALEAR